MSNQANASFEDEELTEFGLDRADEEDDRDPSIQTQSQQSRGRPRIPEKWTRVINTSVTEVGAVRTFQLASDLLVAAGLSKNKPAKRGQAWAPEFCPKQFVKDNPRIKVVDYEATEE